MNLGIDFILILSRHCCNGCYRNELNRIEVGLEEFFRGWGPYGSKSRCTLLLGETGVPREKSTFTGQTPNNLSALCTGCKRKHDVIPKFLTCKTTKRNLQGSSAYRCYQRRLLVEELKIEYRQEEQLTNQHTAASLELKKNISWIDFHHLTNLIENLNLKNHRQT
ncbi:uncharacterized protein LOC111089516 [Limulus polyphemus]|uniref:Uncharacterized protein LOC111089516 n=1 Tax=Limulus polyphemus TaxID=6850 RepID=A0ABM1TPR5_LIMPO|nr:uncharacterized protein LOC111089516 [Limulus polyphemus]